MIFSRILSSVILISAASWARPPRLHLSPAEVGRRDRAASVLAAAAEASGGRGGGM
jgi:hypothetical protein